jgi:hypothetical protein
LKTFHSITPGPCPTECAEARQIVEGGSFALATRVPAAPPRRRYKFIGKNEARGVSRGGGSVSGQSG